jgi:septum site-determining protein MinC
MAKGMRWTLLGERTVTLLRGRLDGLEVALYGRDLEGALAELEARLSEQPSFYRGASAIANVGKNALSPEDVTRLRAVLAGGGIELRALCGSGDGLEELARAHGLAFEVSGPRLSEGARSLVADFAGARNDIAQRRKRGEASVRRAKLDPESVRPVHELRLVDAPASTLYHCATLRGGQTLHHTGNIVVVGDVNPGAELIATGDILVFGRLAGIAHAGAQGDEDARIYACDLAATQLRIATFIAADDSAKRGGSPVPEAALARDGQIVILRLDGLRRLAPPGASFA